LLSVCVSVGLFVCVSLSLCMCLFLSVCLCLSYRPRKLSHPLCIVLSRCRRHLPPMPGQSRFRQRWPPDASWVCRSEVKAHQLVYPINISNYIIYCYTHNKILCIWVCGFEFPLEQIIQGYNGRWFRRPRLRLAPNAKGQALYTGNDGAMVGEMLTIRNRMV